MLFRSVSQSRYKSVGGEGYVEGVGGEGYASSSNHGVYLNEISNIASSSGNITITGTAHPYSSSTDSDDNAGIVVSGSVDTGVSGNITLTGFGGVSGFYGDNNEGVKITGSGSVTLDDGTIPMTGTAGGGPVGGNNRGIRSGGTIQAQGNGNITLTGFGAGGYSNNDGVHIVTGKQIGRAHV